ncbi:MAG: LysR substrate-binding domain-containing protein [Rhodanobacteraceae bacterium]
MNRPPLHALQGFVTAARKGNLTHAAQSMHLTVSALSHQIRGLEQRLGLRLFGRSARGVKLTTDGERLYQRVASHFDALDDALRPYRARRDDVLTLTVMPSFASSWLVPRLPRFLAAQPQLEINLQSNATLVDFDRDTAIDAGLRYGPGQWPGLQVVHLFDDHVTPCASPELIARCGRPSLSTLGRFPLLGAPGSRWSEWFAHFGGTAPARFVASFDDSETLQRAAVEGLGVALGRMSLIRPMVEAGRLLTLFDQSLKAEFAHYLVYPQRSAEHAGLAAFRTWLLDEADDYASRDAVPKPHPPSKSGKRRARRR